MTYCNSSLLIYGQLQLSTTLLLCFSSRSYQFLSNLYSLISSIKRLISFFCLKKKAEGTGEQPESILNIKYGISGDRTIGAHPPFINRSTGVDGAGQELIFKSAITLQRPVLDPCLAVGFLPLPSDGLRVGQLVKMQWRVERLKDLDVKKISEQNVSPSKQQNRIFAIFSTFL